MRRISPTLAIMRVFLIIWFGQTVSVLGSSLTSFALGIWLYQRTGQVTQFAIVLFAATLPPILLSPIAGLIADRWSRRSVMIAADSGSALSTLVIVLLLMTGQLEAWHIYLATTFSAIMGTFQGPAYGAAIPQLVPAEQLGRANGMSQISRSLGQLVAPVLGGVLFVTIGLQGVILIDLITFLFGVTTLLLVRFPPIPPTTDADAGEESWVRNSLAGWRYLIKRPGLLGLLLFFTSINFFLGSIEVLVTPLALSFTTPEMLGLILSTGGVGMLVGSLVLSFWGGPKRKIHAVLLPQLVGGFCIILAGVNVNVAFMAVVAFVYFFGIPISDGCTATLFQQKVPLDMQGRVFAVTSAITSFILPISYLIVSALADRVFEPLMQPGGALANVLGGLVGVGEGRGIGLIFMMMGALAMLATLLAYLYTPLRSIEDDLPDALSVPAAIDTPSVNQTAV